MTTSMIDRELNRRADAARKAIIADYEEASFLENFLFEYVEELVDEDEWWELQDACYESTALERVELAHKAGMDRNKH